MNIPIWRAKLGISCTLLTTVNSGIRWNCPSWITNSLSIWTASFKSTVLRLRKKTAAKKSLKRDCPQNKIYYSFIYKARIRKKATRPTTTAATSTSSANSPLPSSSRAASIGKANAKCKEGKLTTSSWPNT